MQVKHLDHLNLTVRSLEETRDFYQRCFGFEVVEAGVSRGTPYQILASGDAVLCAYEAPDRKDPRQEIPGAPLRHTINHLGLRITDRAAWEAKIQSEDLDIHYGGPVDFPYSVSWYLSDPTGYTLEVALWDQDRLRFPSQGSPKA